ncbi:polysaccharide pyruvyl transferase family protein [Devosia aurantiaca]|uniref:Polysaccharide pyruvyl transferase family protein n=1 Tax=Devosia aurantiaca TaxID=2714858 RepID=A0A6M1SPB2_9HYPH|nr:polysaccharide pyruvyl transferase family protein [Devosia aurantiaca]NGP18514.1 polysaccharide pyruvyl transferase family protein [Devosia aurantiaca]
MLSVDAALPQMLARNGIDADVTYFSMIGGETLEAPEQSTFSTRTYRELNVRVSYHEYDVVLIWGDFLHSRHFHTDVTLSVKQKYPGRQTDEIENTIYKCLMMEGQPSTVLDRTICFGGSLYINGPCDDWDHRYRSAVERLYSQARLVLTRDPVSAAFARMYGARGATLGVDASFLLEPSGRLQANASQIGYSFGRGIANSHLARIRTDRLVSAIRKDGNFSKIVNLRWLEKTDMPPMVNLQQKLEQITNCALVVTDTYHCAINAWREGVPAFCVGLGTEYAENTLSEKKKELLYSMFNARDFYVYAERISLVSPHKMARKLLSVYRDQNISKLISRNILMATQMAERALIQAIMSPGHS